MKKTRLAVRRGTAACAPFVALALALHVAPVAVAQVSVPQLRQNVGSAIFYVEMQSRDDPEVWVRAGTATLIDRRGWFVTASHTFASTYSGPDKCDKRAAYPGALRLTNEAGLVIAGQEEAGFPHGRLDLSLIRGRPTSAEAAKLNLIAPPDVILGDPMLLPEIKATLLAYALSAPTLSLNGDFALLSIPDARKPLILSTPVSYSGQSGGPAITPEAKLAGVLIGPSMSDCSNQIRVSVGSTQPFEQLEFTGLMSASARELLLRIPEDPISRGLADALSGKPADYDRLEAELSSGAVRTLALLKADALLRQEVGRTLVASTAPATGTSAPGFDRDRYVQLLDLAITAALKARMWRTSNVFAQFCPQQLTASSERCIDAQAATPMYVAASLSKADLARPETAELREAAISQLAQLTRSSPFSALAKSSPEKASRAYAALGDLYSAELTKQSEALQSYTLAWKLDAKNVPAKFAAWELNVLKGDQAQARILGADLLKQFGYADSGKKLSNAELNGAISNLRAINGLLGSTTTFALQPDNSKLDLPVS